MATRIKIEVLKSNRMTDGWFWRMKAGNGETLAHSETYTTKRRAYGTASKIAKLLAEGGAKVVFRGFPKRDG